MNRISSREEDLFTAALARPTAKRAVFLEQACGADKALRGRLEALLAAHDGPDSLALPSGTPEFAAIPDEKPGDMIGRYKLLQRLGEGGCGVVYMAEQAEPVRRRVALKVIKAGMDTREVMARFAAERQALALMEHAGIAQVLDAGATDAGRPFFVMELVRGVPITKYCDVQGLSTAARLNLFMQVCQAVQHAHQKGIIHRDLKPSNILVTLNDTTATPKVIDFGIAKATQGRLTDSTLVTALDQFIGTPAYMSPEQAERTGLDIDTRTDVYSLGVVLYELLAGQPPFDPKTLVQSSRDELRRIIREVEPPKPSTRLAKLPDNDRTCVAKARDTEPAKLSQLLQRDLDWIVMKALEKNRARRYESPTALADDIARFLANEPVLARPPSRLYRLKKVIRRHRLAFAAAVAIVLTLMAGIVASTWQAVRARQAEHRASVEKLNAEAEQARAEKVVTFMLGDLRKQITRGGQLGVLEAVGDEAMKYFGSLDAHNVSDMILLRHAQALTQIGEIRVAQAKFPPAADSFRAAYARAATLVARNPKNGDMLFERGQAEYWIGYVHRKNRDMAAAKTWLTRYRDSCVALAALDPSRPEWQSEVAYGHHNLAVLDLDENRLELARAGFTSELAMLDRMLGARPGDFELQARIAEARSFVGTVAECAGELKEAAAHFADAIARLEAVVRSDPNTVRWKARLTAALQLQADLLSISGQRDAASASRARAMAIIDGLVATDPKNRVWRLQSIHARLRETRTMHIDGKTGDALRQLTQLREQLERLVAEEPGDHETQLRLGIACRMEAEWTTNPAVASLSVQRAVELCEMLLRAGTPTPLVVSEAARTRIAAGRIAAARASHDEALQHWHRALALLEPHYRDSRHSLLLDPAANVLALLGRHEESRELTDRLRRIGYVSLAPWAASSPVFPSATATQNQN